MKKYEFICLKNGSYEETSICSTLTVAKRTAKRWLDRKGFVNVIIRRINSAENKIDDTFNEIECTMWGKVMICTEIK